MVWPTVSGEGGPQFSWHVGEGGAAEGEGAGEAEQSTQVPGSQRRGIWQLGYYANEGNALISILPKKHHLPIKILMKRSKKYDVDIQYTYLCIWE